MEMKLWGAFEYRFLFCAAAIAAVLLFDLIWYGRRWFFRRKKAVGHRNAEKKVSAKRSTADLLQLFAVPAGSLLILVMGYLGIVRIWSVLPAVSSTYPLFGEATDSYGHPVEFIFNVPVDTHKLSKNISPEVEGTWKFDTYAFWLPFSRHLSFTPDSTFLPGQKVMIYLAYMADPFHPAAGEEYLLEYTAPLMPSVASSSPVTGALDVPVDTRVEFSLDIPYGPQVRWQATVDPLVEFSFDQSDPGLVAVVFSKVLNQSTAYTVTLTRTPQLFTFATGETADQGAPEAAAVTVFTTVRVPGVASFTPSGEGVLTSAPVVLTFDARMDTASVEPALQVDPLTAGSFAWDETGTVATFTHDPFAKDTVYTVKLAPGIRTLVGGRLEQEAVFSFQTVGVVKVVSTSPGSGAGGIGTTTPIIISFNQAVDLSSAQDAFSLSPAMAGSFAWDGNTMTYSPNGYDYGTTYTYRVAAGVRSIEGLDSVDAVSDSFTTQPQRVLLDVPYIAQGQTGDGAKSCNIVAAQILLAYRGVFVSTTDLRNEIGYQEPYDGSNHTGGNPHLGFTPNYGTYWEPVAAEVNRYRTARFLPEGDLTALLTEVANGNPVMIWGQNGVSTPTRLTWTTPDGTVVTGVNGLHSVVVRGFTGTPGNPTRIYLNDPWYGQTNVAPSTFMTRWYFNVAMVVD